jgi:hypothetical protein
MDTFNKTASQLMSTQCANASAHISGVDMYHATPLKWPPRSPDLNPCDFWLWLWRMVKADVCVTKLHDINTEGGKKDHCCHPKNSSACVCVCVCVCAAALAMFTWFQTCLDVKGGHVGNGYVFSRRYMQKICTKYFRSSLSYEWQPIQVSSCIWTKKSAV